METIVLKPIVHRNKDRIGIYFDHNVKLNGFIQRHLSARWSKVAKCWHIELNRSNYEKLTGLLKEKATIDNSALSKYLKAKKAKAGIAAQRTPAVVKNISLSTATKKVNTSLSSINQIATHYKGSRIWAVNAHVLTNMHEHLQLKAYSLSTQRTYLGEMKHFLGLLKAIPADDLEVSHIKRYLLFCFQKLQVTENTLHSRINALKYYYEQVLGREKFFWEIPRPKKQFQLPNFFNQDEIVALLRSVDNIKHKTMLMLAYSAGLRVSEVVGIKTRDIDSKRMCILVKQAKGKKDRLVSLSPLLLIMLREYWKKYKPAVNGYLFTGQYKDEAYSTRSLQLVVAAAKQKAGIVKPGSMHALRHSFATHLLDKGTDVTMIMKLLGHNDIKTTLRYLHVTNRDMLQILSPLDSLSFE